MTTVSSRVFSANPIHYLNLASKESVEVKRGKMTFQITPKPQFENISPSGDPYWADPRNVAELNRILKEREEGKQPIVAVLRTSKEIREFLGLSEDEV
ncbi:MAG: hypothetical protein LBP96_04565 [Bacteroidales bacterium]|nr:hypothetical protein [Bacteroidales bacterium]